MVVLLRIPFAHRLVQPFCQISFTQKNTTMVSTPTTIISSAAVGPSALETARTETAQMAMAGIVSPTRAGRLKVVALDSRRVHFPVSRILKSS
ncbi:MAG TPA: hypothetical protein VM030_01330 [Acidimicrobiales bacterium]|nr:hypothetical protein [Acidimicrobiales bacterium]